MNMPRSENAVSSSEVTAAPPRKVDLLLVQPAMGGFENSRGWLIEPTGLLYLSRLAVQRYRVVILDERVEGDGFYAKLDTLLAERPLLLGLTSSSGQQLKHALAVARHAKQVSRVPVVFGGPFASQVPATFLAEPSIDYVVMGEGELVVAQMLDALTEGRPVEGIAGVSYRTPDDVRVSRSQKFQRLDELPEVPFHLLKSPRYYSMGWGRRTVQVETSRGCPEKCHYCYIPVVHQSVWRSMSPARAIELVKQSLQDTGVNRVYFTDDNFFLHMGRARQIVEGLKPLNISWGVQGVCLGDVLKMDHEMLQLLHDSGCQGLHIGIQTASKRLHQQMETGAELDDVPKVNAILARYRIPVWYYFMCGFPTETLDELKASCELATRLVAEHPLAVTSGFYLATPYPNTALSEAAEPYGGVKKRSLDDWAAVVWNKASQPWLDDERRRVVEAVHFLSLFHDKKSEYYVSTPLVRLFGRLYRPIARYRLRTLDLRFFFFERLLWSFASRRMF